MTESIAARAKHFTIVGLILAYLAGSAIYFTWFVWSNWSGDLWGASGLIWYAAGRAAAWPLWLFL